MKIMTIFGTRPEIIRLCRVIQSLDKHCQQVLVHTGQNYDKSLSDVFLEDLGLRAPDAYLSVRGSGFAQQAAQILERCDAAFAEHRPDRVLILGDTNSGLAALPAARRHIPIFHMEAGNRCFDDRVPEEVNRRVIDHCSTILMPYTTRSAENLVREGIARERIFVTGNPIYEVLEHFRPQIAASTALADLDVAAKQFFLVTLHRAENVDGEARLRALLDGLCRVQRAYDLPMLLSLHPRTADRMRSFGLDAASYNIHFLTPLRLFDFVHLEQHAACVISDSGTVQEECCIFGVPNVTLRDVTERPETVECGSNILCGAGAEAMLRAVNVATQGPRDWRPPQEYLERHASLAITKIITGYHHILERG
jgi:UDP-N-acetylglucosamine 2-epimerase (non-hydrolysing)